MPVHVTALDITLRLAAAALAGALIGLDRGARGHIAGLRTTMLICLAAAGAMIEANLMLAVDGKTGASFSVMDTLRFPLGILSGIGFIGAGAILKQGRLVTGVTTAATIWFVTVDGLVIGGGYFGFGAGFTGIALTVLAGLKQVERILPREHHADLHLRLAPDGPGTDALRDALRRHGLKISNFSVSYGETRDVGYAVSWWSAKESDDAPALVEELFGWKGVLGVDWTPQDVGHLTE